MAEAAVSAETVFAAAPIGLGLLAPGGHLRLANAALLSLLRLPSDAVARDLRLPHAVQPGSDGATLLATPLPDGWTVVTVIGPAEAPQAERAPEASADRAALLEMVLLNVPHGICVYGPDRRVAMFNDTYIKVMQGAPLQLGDSLADVIRRRADAHEYGDGDSDRIFAEQMAHDIGRPQMRRRVRPNGTAIDIRTVPLPNGGHLSVVTDMTALVRAEDAVRRRAQEMATMLSSIRHGIVLWGADHRLIASNPIAGELLGLPGGILSPGRPEAEVIEALLSLGELGDGVSGTDRARLLLSADRTRPFTREFRTRSGRILTAQSKPAPDGGWVTTYTDITPMRRAEAELRAARDQAEAASRAKSRFLATMGHELRTPLNAIIGFSDVLVRARGQAPRDEVAEFSQQINQAGQHLLSLIDTILNVARLDTGRFETSQDSVDVMQMLNLIGRQVESAAQAGEVTVSLDVQEGLPRVRADERQLQQALMQIVANGVKFTPAGGSVDVRAAARAGGGLEIVVADTGIGIDTAKLGQVFAPFVQAEETLSRRYSGTGLGLFMARAIVVAHDGTLTLESAAGRGTTARILLPSSRLLKDDPAV